MTYALGIDMGSARLTAAVLDDTGAPARLLRLGEHSATSAALYFGDSGLVVGDAAVDLGLEHPELLVRDYLARVGDDVPISVGGYVVAPEDAVALVARWVADRAEELEGGAPGTVTVTYPATWGSYRRTIVENALAGVGFGTAQLVGAGTAAVASRADFDGVAVGQVVAVYDLGGDFELTFLERGVDGDFVVRSGGCVEQHGGADFDDAVFAHVGSTLELESADAVSPAALSRVWQTCTAAKEALSFDTEVTLPVDLDSSSAEVHLVRAEFEALIDDLVRSTIGTVRRQRERAGIHELAGILLVGGSARVPLVAELLSEEFRTPIVIDRDPAASVALGAATLGARSLPEPAPVAAVPEVRRTGIRKQLVLAAAAAAVIALSLVVPRGGTEARGLQQAPPGVPGLFWPDQPAAAQPVVADPQTPAPDAGDDETPVRRYDYSTPSSPSTPGSSTTQPVGHPSPQPSVVPEPDPTPSTDPSPDPSPDPDPSPEPDPEPEPEPDPSPAPDPLPEPVDDPGSAAPLE